MIVQARGVSLDLPAGWEAEIDDGAGKPEPGAEVLSTPRIHIANFPLPGRRGDYGSGAVERMVAGDAIVCLLEAGSDAVNSAVYAHRGMPRLDAADFSPNRMQRPLNGQAGAQKFFTVAGRAFGLYVALGASSTRRRMAAEVNRVLDGVTIRPD